MIHLTPGTRIRYLDINGIQRELIYIRTPGMIMGLRDQPPCPQLEFYDERGYIMHTPLNAWSYVTNIEIEDI